jgi:hypothetical protein
MNMKQYKKHLKDALDIQTADGNWNSDPYMHGMANGMIFCMAMLEDKEPEYLKAPKFWLSDLRVINDCLSGIEPTPTETQRGYE